MNNLLKEYLQSLENFGYEFADTAEEDIYNILKDNKFLGVAEISDEKIVKFTLREDDNEFRAHLTNQAFKWKISIIDTKTFEIIF